jgi:hypothetical protein
MPDFNIPPTTKCNIHFGVLGLSGMQAGPEEYEEEGAHAFREFEAKLEAGTSSTA